MKLSRIASLAILIAMFAFGHVLAEENAQGTCPVMGGKINKKIYADHEGKRVYFCCKGCIGEFKASPEKYIDALESEGVELEKVPVNTPGNIPGEEFQSRGCSGCSGCS